MFGGSTKEVIMNPERLNQFLLQPFPRLETYRKGMTVLRRDAKTTVLIPEYGMRLPYLAFLRDLPKETWRDLMIATFKAQGNLEESDFERLNQLLNDTT